MSAVFYDEAFLKKLKSWTEKAKVNLYGPSDARKVFEIEADLHNDKPIKLPIIVLNRNGYEIKNFNRTPMTFDGKRLYADEQKVKQVNAIPIVLTYTLDVYARFYEEADAYMRELIFNIINYPQLEIVVPYLSFNYKHYSNIRIVNNQVSDNSGSVAISKDQIVKLSIDISIDDAYLWDARVRNTVAIGEGIVVNTVSETYGVADSEPVTID